MTLNDLFELSKKTGWKIINPNNDKYEHFCPQISYNDRSDDKNIACIWWDDNLNMYRLCCIVEGKTVYNDRRLNFVKIETLVKWVIKCEQKMKEKREELKLKKILKDF